MTDDEVEKTFKAITGSSRATYLAGVAIAWILVAAVLACAVLGVFALARVVL